MALIYLHLCRWVLNPASIICWGLTLCLCYPIALLTVAYIYSIWPRALLLLGDLRQLALLAEWIGPSNNGFVVLLSSSVNCLCLELHFLLLAQSYLPTCIVHLLPHNSSLVSFLKVFDLVLVQVYQELVHDLLGLSIVDDRLLFARLSSLPFAGLDSTDRVHEGLDRLLVFLFSQTRLVSFCDFTYI